jgi:cell division transport system permease protein
MLNLLRQHSAACSDALKQILSAPGNFFFNIIVVAVALALPIGGLTVLENVRPISGQLAIEPELSLFLKTEVSRSEATALLTTITGTVNNTGIPAKIVFVPREDALYALQKSTGLSDILSTLGDNPLPDAVIISFEQRFQLHGAQTTPEKIQTLSNELEKIPQIDHVQIDSLWIKRLSALLQLAQFTLSLLAITLAIVVITVIFNATRLQVMSHQAELAVIRLLGATNHYIQRPYYYAGVITGLASGLIALVVVAAVLHPLNQAIAEFANLYASEFQIHPLNVQLSCILLVLSCCLGWIGAFLSVRYYVNKLN